MLLEVPTCVHCSSATKMAQLSLKLHQSRLTVRFESNTGGTQVTISSWYVLTWWYIMHATSLRDIYLFDEALNVAVQVPEPPVLYTDCGWHCNAFVKLFGWQRERELQTRSWMVEFGAEEDQMMTSSDSSIVRDSRKSSARRQQLGDWRQVNYILSLSLGGKRLFRTTFHLNPQPTRQMWCCKTVCARILLCTRFLIILPIKPAEFCLPSFWTSCSDVFKYMLVRRNHMLLLVMSHLQFIAHLGAETFNHKLAKWL